MAPSERSAVPLEDWLAERQRRFYAAEGVSAFSGTVPFRLSTSRATARLVLEAARRFARAVEKPKLRIVDVGAGSGRLAYHLRAIDPDVSLVLTDASSAMCEALRAHPQLGGATVVHAPAEDLGAALDVAPDEALVVVGTYLLDTLPHALVRADGQRAFVDASGQLTFAPAYVDAFTHAYLARLRHGAAFLPVGASQFVRALERQLTAPALLLVADKMATSIEAAREGERPRLVQHGAGASALVNLDALRRWLGWRGWCQAPGGSDDFVVGGTVLRGRVPLDGLFDGAVHPLDAQRVVSALRDAADVASRITTLPPDGDTLLELADALVAAPHVASKDALGEWLLTAAREAFVLPADDVPFHAGRVLLKLGFAGAAVACFSTSLERHGDATTTRLHRASALLGLGAREHALADVETVLSAQPANPDALALRAAVFPSP